MDAPKANKNHIIQLNQLKTTGVLEDRKKNLLNSDQTFQNLPGSTLQESPAPIQSVNKLNMSLFNKLQFNAQSIGKRFIHKSSTGISSRLPTQLGNSTVTHHPLNLKGNNTSGNAILSTKNQISSPLSTKIEDFDTVVKPKQPVDIQKNSKVIRSLMNPDNPFSKLTDKDLLLFNPNYEAYLHKLNKNQNKISELSRIMS